MEQLTLFPSFFCPKIRKGDLQMANKNIVAQLEKNKSDIEKKQEEIRQLKNEERQILSTQRKAEQKIRTRKLIERGAILESVNPSILSISNEELKTYLQQVLQTEQAKKLLQSITQSVKLDKSLV